ncbi:MAG: hypothetical protein ACFBSC_07080 [Microcoleaceae cyanobacterium]
MANPNRPELPSGARRSALIDLLTEYVERVFARTLESHTPIFESNSVILQDAYPSFVVVLREVQSQGDIGHLLSASVEFLLGREAYSKDQLQTALEHYQKSLEFWPTPLTNPDLHSEALQALPNHYFLERMGVVLFHLGLNYARLGDVEKGDQSRAHRREAQTYLQQCLGICEQAERQDLAAKFVGQLARVVQQLEDWEALTSVAQQAINLHISYGSDQQIAQDYTWLAEVAMRESKWTHATQLMDLSLAIHKQSLISPASEAPNNESCFLLWAESQQELEHWQALVTQLERARRSPILQQDHLAYLQVLQALRKLYFEQNQYGQAAHLKQEQFRIRYQQGLSSFMGIRQLQPRLQARPEKHLVALEILNSDRLKDVNTLVDRIQSQKHKLVILHGKSGVGKSSLLTAGVMPTLIQKQLESENTESTVPILLRIYTDWLRNPDPATWNLTGVLKLVEKNCAHQLSTVLIFDQFEELFTVCPEMAQRRPLYQFLRSCLLLEGTTVLLSIRTDYLHYLIEWDRLMNLSSVIQADILSQPVLYHLEQFSVEQVQRFIQNQTATSATGFDFDLIEKVVEDLEQPWEGINPVEVQLVGGQLQAKGITTLAQYQRLGKKSKQVLLGQFLDGIIVDCGQENELIVISVLYALTNEVGTRPVKTESELRAELDVIPEKLELVLEVLVEYGLILLLPDIPDNRYQLAHDYLIQLIRQQQGQRRIAELELERNKAQRKLAAANPRSWIDQVIISVLKWFRSD